MRKYFYKQYIWDIFVYVINIDKEYASLNKQMGVDCSIAGS